MAPLDKIAALVEKRERYFRRLQSCYDMIKKLPEKQDIFLLRAADLPELRTEFEEIQDKIITLNQTIAEVKDRIDTQAPSAAFDEIYYHTLCVCKKIKKEEAAAAAATSTAGKPSEVPAASSLKVNLPKIDIPKFKNEIENFNSFKALFDSLIHNSSLTSIEKFSYLLSSTEGEAHAIVKSVHFDPSRYQDAYDKLVTEYTKPRRVACYYLNKIFDQQPTRTANVSNLRQIRDIFQTNVSALKDLNIQDLVDFVFLQMALRLLDPHTRREFEQEYKKTEFPTLDNLLDFLRDLCDINQFSKDMVKPSVTPMLSNRNKSLMVTQPNPLNTNQNNGKSFSKVTTAIKCPFCKSDHQLYRCFEFKKLSIPQRHSTIRSLKRCFACFGTHMLPSCASTSKCQFCGSKSHHSLLHELQQPASHGSLNPPAEKKVEEISETEPTEQQVALPSVSPCAKEVAPLSSTVLLSTAQVQIQDSYGNWHSCRAVLDTGSSLNFITNALAQSLALTRRKCSVSVTGIGNSPALTSKGQVTCTLASRFSLDHRLSFEAVVIPQITGDLPTSTLAHDCKARFTSLPLADPNFNTPGKIEVLIGAQTFPEILTEDAPILKGQPTALKTCFGWILIGKISTLDSPTQATALLTQPSPPIDDLLRQFWETEEVSLPPIMDPADQICEDHFRSTISRDATGRYIARLPFKETQSAPELGSTQEVARRKFIQLEKRFQKQPEFKTLYCGNLQDYVDQGHMKLASTPSDYVMTHHGVLKNSSTTQLRVVFNASELSTTNTSLNKSLLKGPKLQADIGEIIMTFRFHAIAITCDIKQMYRAIRLHPDDCKYQQFYWRFDPTQPLQLWELKTVTFGMTSSPFIAQRVLKQLAVDEGERYPLAAKALTTSCYIDDIVTGASSEEDAIELHRQLTSLLAAGGFELRKWASSSAVFLQSISSDLREKPHPLGSTQTVKVLGLEWDPSTDCFRYCVHLSHKPPTKRNLLSQIARIYDVNGYLSPVIFLLKHLLQQLWLANLGWDDMLPPKLERKWNAIATDFSTLNDLQIPRYILNDPVCSVELLGFSDASTMGICAALYLRIVSADGTVSCHLIQAKTKVAPLKTLTIPRLELNAALLLSKLLRSSHSWLHSLQISVIKLFTDSTTVLDWLQTPPHLLEIFVANRVIQILDATANASWYHISGDLNPADLGSRGLLPTALVRSSLWWYGPAFLLDQEHTWSVTPFASSPALLTLNLTAQNCSEFYQLITRFSSFLRLQRTIAFLLRFIENCRQKHDQRKLGPLTSDELQTATNFLVKIVQYCHYSTEIRSIAKGDPCSRFLRKLSPCVSKDGLLMVGGRLRFAPLPEAAKHPYLLPANSHLALLLCDYFHDISLHGGPQIVQALLTQQFWIPGARNLIRKRIFKCLKCYKFKSKPVQPYMADLPKSRFAQGRCFLNVGLDFGGPFDIKESHRRKAPISKCYIALFVCMSTKAIHLELVHSLTTEACLAALDRFIARRGLPHNLYSDQGRNFVGAARRFQEIDTLLQQSNAQIADHLSHLKVNWIFNPPRAPNFGGIWEAGIKSTKHHLKRILTDHIFTQEEFATFLCRIEAILNSRPLCQLSNSPIDGFDYLSPGHFLIGAPLLARPEEPLEPEPRNLTSRWQRITAATQSFWKRWSQEYLHTQIQRPKWTEHTAPLKEGDLVLMYSPVLPPLQWPLARITKLYPGNDAIVRVVQIRTSSGTSLIRPVNKLVVLPEV